MSDAVIDGCARERAVPDHRRHLVVLDLAIRIAALIIVPRDRKPTAAMAWLLAIFLIPFIGIILFLVIGNSKLPKTRRASRTSSTA